MRQIPGPIVVGRARTRRDRCRIRGISRARFLPRKQPGLGSDRAVRTQVFVSDFIHFAEDYSGQPMDTLYDRAALVALPEDMRPDYVTACEKLLIAPPQGLLVTLEYEPISMEGPPFSVAAAEIDRLWKGQLVLVEQVDMLSSMPRAVASGVQRLDEYLWVFR